MDESQPAVCDYEGSPYQTAFWGEGDRAYEDQVERIALRRLLPAQGKRALEIGAGFGRLTGELVGFEQVVLLDYSRSMLREARQRLGGGPRYRYVAANVYRLPFAPGAFDAATMIRVIHHMADAPAALRQVRAALADGGAFVLEFANKRHLKSIVRFLLPTGLLVKLDSLAQLTGDWWQYTPSVFVLARAPGAPGAINPALFRCPACGSPDVEETDVAVNCPACGRRYPLREGIYDFKEPDLS